MPLPVVVQFEREVTDDVTGEVTGYVLITVEGEYCEGDASVGEGEHLHAELSYMHGDETKTPIEITDWEEDQLLSIYKGDLEYERGWEMDHKTKENKHRGE